jgi:hypothetical protein
MSYKNVGYLKSYYNENDHLRTHEYYETELRQVPSLACDMIASRNWLESVSISLQKMPSVSLTPAQTGMPSVSKAHPAQD